MEQLKKHDDSLDKKIAVKTATRDLIIIILVFLVVAATAFYLGRTYFESWPISGSSMEPNIHHGDRVIVFKTKKIDYDDVIIFQTESGGSDIFSGKYLIKRVVGKPGDHIEVRFSNEDNAWHVYRNGEIVTEKFIKDGIKKETYAQFYEKAPEGITVPEDCYFVLGDNRNNSHDSHVLGLYAHEEDVVGKVLIRYKAISDFSFLQACYE